MLSNTSANCCLNGNFSFGGNPPGTKFGCSNVEVSIVATICEVTKLEACFRMREALNGSPFGYLYTR